jgi:hypothetical protein
LAENVVYKKHTPAAPVVGIPTGRMTKSPVQGRRVCKGEHMADEPVTEVQLKAALEPITREINDMRYDMGEMKRIIQPLQEKAEKNYKYLFGNGEAGLDERVRNIERSVDSAKTNLRWVALAVGGYVLVEIVKVLLTHF